MPPSIKTSKGEAPLKKGAAQSKKKKPFNMMDTYQGYMRSLSVDKVYNAGEAATKKVMEFPAKFNKQALEGKKAYDAKMKINKKK